jgi:hypothetical protein
MPTWRRSAFVESNATAAKLRGPLVGPPKRLMNKVSGVYEIAHLPTGAVYVGASRDVAARFRQHLADLRGGYSSCALLQKVFLQDGEGAFEMRVVAFCPAEELEERERELWQTRCSEGRSLNSEHYSAGGLPRKPK